MFLYSFYVLYVASEVGQQKHLSFCVPAVYAVLGVFCLLNIALEFGLLGPLFGYLLERLMVCVTRRVAWAGRDNAAFPERA
jgi:hypothetical protein